MAEKFIFISEWNEMREKISETRGRAYFIPSADEHAECFFTVEPTEYESSYS